MTIFYKLRDKLYVNITNICSCACVFCIRDRHEGVGDAESLWLPREPEPDEIRAAFDLCELSGMTESVFCGYGEPMERADTVMETARYIKSKSGLPVRINTNGLVKLIDPGFDLERLRGVDAVSVSLNAGNAEEYRRVTRPRFGPGAYESMLTFAREAAAYTKVTFTIVDVLDEERTAQCRAVAAGLGIPLRVRSCQ